MPAPAATAPPPKNRKAFVRTKVPAAERAASWVILGLLVVIAGTIWRRGHQVDPNRFALRPDALKSTTAAIEGKSGTARSTDIRPEEAAMTAAPATTRPPAAAAPAEEEGAEPVEGSKPAAAPVTGPPLELKIEGAQPMSATEFYNAENLYEKIDGRAPAYLTFNFQQLRCRSFSVSGNTGSFVDVFEYRFDTPINAFGMFALERDPKGKKLDFAPDGYAGEMGWFFRQGNCYVQVIASDQNTSTLKLGEAIARNRAAALPADDSGLEARRRLPSAGLDPASVSFMQDSAQGQPFLKNVFQASYNFSGKSLTFFLMVTNAAEAAAGFQAYQEFSGRFGGKVAPLPDASGARLFSSQNFGSWKVIYQRAGELGGVIDAQNAEDARQFVEQYLAGKLQ